MQKQIKTVCSLATLLLVFGTSLLTPPLRHAHSADTTPHSHAHEHHGHSHHHGNARTEKQSVSSHFHLCWLFLNYSILESETGGSGAEESDLRLPPTVLPATVSVELGAVSGGEFLPVALAVCSETVVAGQSCSFADRQPMPDCDRLCDAARRERTGVLVI